MHSSTRHLLFALLLIGLLALSIREFGVRPDGKTHATILDVGQGNAAFVRSPSGRQILIDGGPHLAALEGIGKRMSFFDRTIDLLVLSHPNLDHLFAFPEILRRYRVSAVLLPDVPSDLPRYREFLSLLEAQHIPVLPADPRRDIDLGDGLLLDVLWPAALRAGDDVNDASVVVKLRYGADTILLPGDIEAAGEERLLASGADTTADVLVIAHHGSRTSSSTGFLLAVRPERAILSVGRDNDYGHPHPEILARLRSFAIPVQSTAQEGDIEVVMDGR